MSSPRFSSVLNHESQVVAAVHSPGALRHARKIRKGAVDFLEIRVDSFAENPTALLKQLPALRIPLLITIRHPAEGGANRLPLPRRRELFSQFLPFARAIDIELRSAKALAGIIRDARARGVTVIISDHHFKHTPPPARLRHTIRRARAAGADICKIAARADTPADLEKLLALLSRKSALPLSVMAMGRFGKISRLLLAQSGSVLNYGYLDQPNASGQWEATLLKTRLAELASG
jgi:3-dehydroquinate dehydratase-1